MDVWQMVFTVYLHQEKKSHAETRVVGFTSCTHTFCDVIKRRVIFIY